MRTNEPSLSTILHSDSVEYANGCHRYIWHGRLLTCLFLIVVLLAASLHLKAVRQDPKDMRTLLDPLFTKVSTAAFLPVVGPSAGSTTRRAKSHGGRRPRSFMQQPNRMWSPVASRFRSRHVEMRATLPDEIERTALAGLWSGHLDLDDGLQTVMISLETSGACTVVSNSSSKNCEWSVENKDSKLSLTVLFGSLILQGVGTRSMSNQRCVSVAGSVLEGIDDSVYVGGFKMHLKFSAVDDAELFRLQAMHQARLDARPQPSRFRFDAFVGRWALLVDFSLENQITPLFTLELGGDGRFSSVGHAGVLGNVVRLAGSWSVVDFAASREGATSHKNMLPRAFGDETPQIGTHVLLHLERGKCSGLPAFQEPYSLYGKPELDSMQAELAAKSHDGSAHVDKVGGNVYLKINSREWIMAGDFRLQRESVTA